MHVIEGAPFDSLAVPIEALAACAVAAFACALLRRAALAVGWLDAAASAPGRKRQASPVPPVGGAAIALALLALETVDHGLGSGFALALWWRDADPRWLGLGLACAFAVGLLDDLVAGGLSPFAKVAGQALAGLALAQACAPLASPAIEGSAIVLLAVAAQNALNTFDNADGAAGGLAFAGLAPGASGAAGAVLGFLAFNLAPRRARVYLGDAGSHLLGLLLLLSPHGAAALLLPALDLARLACVRLATGSRPWIGDRRHLAHRLEAAGLGRVATAALLAALAALPVLGHAFFGASGLAWGAAALGLAFVLLLRATPSSR